MTQDNENKPHKGLVIISEMRLSLRQWAAAVAIVTLVAVATPRLWKHLERFQPGPDYRIPYQLSNDYWSFDWRLEKTGEAKPIVVLGDSVVWGEYVKSDGTLPHFLNRQAGQPDRFVNAGVNGLFPLALEGLVRYYGASLHDRQVIVVCNLLWLSSPEADMQADKAQNINHASLVPQFFPRIPCYRADANQRLGAAIERNVGFMGWVDHLQDAYFHQQSILQWTLAEDPDRPGRYPNAWKNPLGQITLVVPSGQGDDADRGPGSQRHKPWTAGGPHKTAFEWVDLKSSLQWAAFRTLGQAPPRPRQRRAGDRRPFQRAHDRCSGPGQIPGDPGRNNGLAGGKWGPARRARRIAQRALRRRQPSLDGRLRIAGPADQPVRGLPQVDASPLTHSERSAIL